MSVQPTTLRPPAQTWQEVDLHVRYVQEGQGRLEDKLDELLKLVPNMATKQDIAELARKFEGYATREDLRSVVTDVELLRQQMESGGVRSQLEKWGSIARNVAAIVALVSASAYFVVGVMEEIQTFPAKVQK